MLSLFDQRRNMSKWTLVTTVARGWAWRRANAGALKCYASAEALPCMPAVPLCTLHNQHELCPRAVVTSWPWPWGVHNLSLSVAALNPDAMQLSLYSSTGSMVVTVIHGP
jgi:hypothetical protein